MKISTTRCHRRYFVKLSLSTLAVIVFILSCSGGDDGTDADGSTTVTASQIPKAADTDKRDSYVIFSASENSPLTSYPKLEVQ